MAELSVNCPKCQAANSVALGAEVETYTCSKCGAENALVDAGPVEAAADPLVGAVISDCKILEKLGEGGFGAVYKAMDQNLARPVALKVMLQSLTSSQEFVQKFIREAITAAQLNHPNIVAIHKVGRDEKRGIHYLIMELLEGKTLEHIIQDKGVLKPEEAVPLMLQASEALAAAHDKKIVHRDIKPENIMVDKRGVVKIMDFGLAKVVQPDMKSTKVMGTPHYMSPEQFEGKQVDGRTDIYSLGVTFYYILSKARPYEGTNTVQIIYAILTSDPKSLLEAAPSTPPEIWTIIQKMIAKKPDERYLDFRDVRKDILAYQEKSLADRVTCPGCGAKNQRGKKFCRQCGGNLQVKCPACNADEVAGAQTCGSCGAAIETLLAVRQNMERALRLKSVGDLRRAFLLLKEVLKLDPAHVQAKKEVDEIDVALKEVESVKTEAIELEKTGNLEDALQKVEDLLGRYPGSDDIKRHRDVIKRAFDSRIIAQHMRRADEALAAGNLPASLSALDNALRLDPKREDILGRRRDLEEKVKAAEAARSEAKKAFDTKRYAEAFRRATEVLRSNPTDADMAQILEKCRGFLESSTEFVKRGRENLQSGKLLDAKQELEAALQLHGDDPEIRTLLAEADKRLGAFRDLLVAARTALGDRNFDEARAKVSEVLKTIPGDPESLGLMATIARQESESRKSSEVQTALDEGEKLEKAGDLEGALTSFRAAVDADPDSGKAVTARDRVESKMREISSVRALADEHLRDGRFEEAMQALEKLTKLLPDDENIQSEAEEAGEKVKHIQTALRRAEKAAGEKNHKETVAASKDVLDLSPNHVRAQSLKRDAERALNAIDRHLKEAERLVGSEIFEDALDQLKKARSKGATQDMVASFEKTAVDGITAALKTEATRFYSAKDYSAALDAYERILELRAEDDDAKKGKAEAEKRLRALTSEPLAMRSVVAGTAATLLLMFQVGAVNLRQPPSIVDTRTAAPVSTADVALNYSTLRAHEMAGDLDKAEKEWDLQPNSFDTKKNRAKRILAALRAAQAPGEDPLKAIRDLQSIDADLDKDRDTDPGKDFFGIRVAAAQKAMEALQDAAIQRLVKVEEEGKDAALAAQLTAAYIDPGLTDDVTHLKASRVFEYGTKRSKVIEAKNLWESGLRRARNRKTNRWVGWTELETNELENAVGSLADVVGPEAETLRAKFAADYRAEWEKDLKARAAALTAKFGSGADADADKEEFFLVVQEAGAFLEKYGLVQDEANRDAFIKGMKGE